MNNQRRKRIDQAIEQMKEAQSILEEVYAEEEAARSNLPEGLQDSEQAQTMDDTLVYLDDANDSLAEAIDSARNAQ